MTREEGAAFGRHSRTPAELSELQQAKGREVAFLLLRDGDGDGAQLIFTLGDRDRVSIGRDDECDLCLRWDDEVSAAHVELTRIGAEWLIRDVKSTNGTFVKGIRLTRESQRLANCDVLVVGGTSIQFLAPRRRVPPTKPTGPVVPAKPLTPMQERVLRSLCRPYCSDPHALPATNQEIADALTMSVDGVKRHLRALYGLYDVAHLPRNHKRLMLAQVALVMGPDPCAS